MITYYKTVDYTNSLIILYEKMVQEDLVNLEPNVMIISGSPRNLTLIGTGPYKR